MLAVDLVGSSPMPRPRRFFPPEYKAEVVDASR
jgi:hypothetical protein